MSNNSQKAPKSAAAPLRNNSLQDEQQRLLLWNFEEHRDKLSKEISGLSNPDEEVSRLYAKADEAAKRAVAIQSSVHPDNDGSHLR